jgi:hypothetical protein
LLNHIAGIRPPYSFFSIFDLSDNYLLKNLI